MFDGMESGIWLQPPLLLLSRRLLLLICWRLLHHCRRLLPLLLTCWRLLHLVLLSLPPLLCTARFCGVCILCRRRPWRHVSPGERYQAWRFLQHKHLPQSALPSPERAFTELKASKRHDNCYMMPKIATSCHLANPEETQYGSELRFLLTPSSRAPRGSASPSAASRSWVSLVVSAAPGHQHGL